MKAEQLSDGDNDDDFSPDLSNYNLLVAGEIAAANGLVASALFQVTFGTSTTGSSNYQSGIPLLIISKVPNQPIVYAEDPDQSRRTEDSSIAFTWLEILTLCSLFA